MAEHHETKAKTEKASTQDNSIFLIAYVLELVTGIIVYLAFSDNNKRLKYHAMQATLIGIFSVIVSFVFSFVPPIGLILAFLIWVYSLYVGFEAYNGRDVDVPVISSYLKGHPDFKPK